MTILEQVEAHAGTLLRYDGKFCLWTTSGVVDLRDALRKCKGLSLVDAQQALIDATEEAHKIAKAEHLAAKEKKDAA